MPSRNYGKGKPWRARIRLHGRDFWLGTYDTYDEAKAIEDRMREKYPPHRGVYVV